MSHGPAEGVVPRWSVTAHTVEPAWPGSEERRAKLVGITPRAGSARVVEGLGVDSSGTVWVGPPLDPSVAVPR